MTEHEETMKLYESQLLSCAINPICNISAKGFMTDPIDFYLYHPAAVLVNKATGLSEIDKALPDFSVANGISIIHVLIGLLGCLMISNGKHRRFGALIFEFSLFLDCLGELGYNNLDELIISY